MGIKVFIVDDHALVRTGFGLILGNEPDIEVVGEAESGEDALPQIRRLPRGGLPVDLLLGSGDRSLPEPQHREPRREPHGAGEHEPGPHTHVLGEPPDDR